MAAAHCGRGRGNSRSARPSHGQFLKDSPIWAKSSSAIAKISRQVPAPIVTGVEICASAARLRVKSMRQF